MQEKNYTNIFRKNSYMNVGELSVTIKNIGFALESSQVSSQITIKKAQKYTKNVLKIRLKKKEKKIQILSNLYLLSGWEPHFHAAFNRWWTDKAHYTELSSVEWFRFLFKPWCHFI